MKIKTLALTGPALDWATSIITNPDWEHEDRVSNVQCLDEDSYSPSTDWSQGGPIIDREIDQLDRINDYPNWEANRFATDKYEDCVAYGPTALIAAMRCFVASKLGNTVEIPEELS